MDAQTIEGIKQIIEGGAIAIGVILALTGLVITGLAWRFLGMWKSRSEDQSELVQAVVTTSQAANKTADHNAEVLKEIRIMRENQATMVNFLTEVDTNVRLVKEQGVKADQNIRLTYDDLVQFRDAVLPVLREIRSSLESHDNHASDRHKTLMNTIDKSGSVIVGDIDDMHLFLDGINAKVTELKALLGTLDAGQRKLIKYAQPVDTDELTSTDTKLSA